MALAECKPAESCETGGQSNLEVEDRAPSCFALCERATERETEGGPGRVASIEGSERLVTVWSRLEMRGEQPIAGEGIGGGPQSEDKECK